MKTFTAYVEWDPEVKVYVGIIPGVPGAHTQAKTLDELKDNLKFWSFVWKNTRVKSRTCRSL